MRFLFELSFNFHFNILYIMCLSVGLVIFYGFNNIVINLLN